MYFDQSHSGTPAAPVLNRFYKTGHAGILKGEAPLRYKLLKAYRCKQIVKFSIIT